MDFSKYVISKVLLRCLSGFTSASSICLLFSDHILGLELSTPMFAISVIFMDILIIQSSKLFHARLYPEMKWPMEYTLKHAANLYISALLLSNIHYKLMYSVHFNMAVLP